MRVWTERQIELRGVYSINLTSTALALVLSARQPALDEIQARLKRVRPIQNCRVPCLVTGHF